ncbi:hypothetical protein L1987_06750 [Smallanthus sonchifolius]|uniref:Uncharacterized protein n=1 Tax=Smallanthus sonchifolius TaxID=185202 RepID=A0ACB9JZ01_9ASTR|nr:hypothetical protein L1987_06750 [Smallanthus sonchifolius]
MSSTNPGNTPLPPALLQEENHIPRPPHQCSPLLQMTMAFKRSHNKSTNRSPRKSQKRNKWKIRKETARKTVLPPKKRTLSSPDIEQIPKRHCLSTQREIIPPNTEMSEAQPDPRTQQSNDTSEESDAIMEALYGRLVGLQGEVGLNDLALGRLHGRVTAGETRLAEVKQGAVVAGQQDTWTNEPLDSFAALTIVNTMLLAFALFMGWFSLISYSA